MKISELNGITAVSAGTKAQASPTPQDKVSLERTKALQQEIEQAKVQAGEARASRLAALEAAIANGSLKPNPQQIAEKLLQDAELDARLRRLLG